MSTLLQKVKNNSFVVPLDRRLSKNDLKVLSNDDNTKSFSKHIHKRRLVAQYKRNIKSENNVHALHNIYDRQKQYILKIAPKARIKNRFVALNHDNKKLFTTVSHVAELEIPNLNDLLGFSPITDTIQYIEGDLTSLWNDTTGHSDLDFRFFHSNCKMIIKDPALVGISGIRSY